MCFGLLRINDQKSGPRLFTCGTNALTKDFSLNKNLWKRVGSKFQINLLRMWSDLGVYSNHDQYYDMPRVLPELS